jgi:polysaccharide deacetylase 2 family uncharacterized protein YibQ
MARWFKRSRLKQRSKKLNNNFLVIFLTLVVIFETILILFLIPKPALKKDRSGVVKRAAVAEAISRKPVVKEQVVRPPEKIPPKLETIAKLPQQGLPGEVKGKIAIIIDDWGYNTNNLELLGEINLPLTIAILPFRWYSKKVAEFAHQHNYEVIIHMPMEPESKRKVDLEPKTLMISMSEKTIKSILRDAFDSIPYAKGINNHMGSLATQNKKLMTIVFADLKQRNYYFLDSLVVTNSVCHEVANEVGVKFVRRSIFLDNVLKSEYIRGQLMELVNEADKKGRAVGIGHDKEATLKILKEVMPQIEKEGYKFVFVSEIVE